MHLNSSAMKDTFSRRELDFCFKWHTAIERRVPYIIGSSGESGFGSLT